MPIEPNQKITFAQTEREKIREHFARRASEAPVPDPLDPESMKDWEDYVAEMRGLEEKLRNAGEVL